MSPSDQAKRRWGVDHALQALERSWLAMAPYAAVIETDAGQRGLCLVSGFAVLVHAGAESPAALADVIKLASTISGIPVDALDAHAQYTFAFLEGAAFHQQGHTPCEAASNEGAEK